MEIAIVEQEKNRTRFELKGTSHTFCNHLKNALQNNSDVTLAAYAIDHPLVGTPTFTVETKGKAALGKLLADAAKSIEAENKDFLSALKKLK